MRILYVIHQFYPESSSGTERFLFGLATSVQRMGHHADVVTYSFCQKSDFHNMGELLVRRYSYKSVSITAIRHSRAPIDINTSMDDGVTMRFAHNFLEQGRYDLVHVAHPMRLTSFAQAALRLDIPYVLTLTDFWILCPKINLHTSFGTLCRGPEAGKVCVQLCPELGRQFVESRLKKARLILEGARAVVVPSKFAESVLLREFADLHPEIIPHGVKSTQMEPTVRNYDGDSKVVFAYCGGLSPHKGVHTLVQAFRSVESERAELLIYGAANAHEKEYEQHLHRLAENDARIRLCGVYSNENLREVFQAIDALVIPSLVYETYSFALHEAFAANVPVIVSAIGVLAEKVEDSVTGLTFPVGDQRELVRKLTLVIENPSTLHTMKRYLCGKLTPLEEEEAYLYERIYERSGTKCKAPSLALKPLNRSRPNE